MTDETDLQQPSGNTDPPESSMEITALRRLAAHSPPLSLSKFRRRASIVQGTRMLFESQVTGFWVVLDAFLRLALGARPVAVEASADGDE